MIGGGMSVDDLLFTIIFGGVVLSIAYLRAQYVMRRSYRIAERGNELRLRELYASQSNTQGSLEGKPVSRAAAPQVSPNPAPQRSLPVHVRYASIAFVSAPADEGHFRRHESQELHI
jgi:hypothetical protein